MSRARPSERSADSAAASVAEPGSRTWTTGPPSSATATSSARAASGGTISPPIRRSNGASASASVRVVEVWRCHGAGSVEGFQLQGDPGRAGRERGGEDVGQGREQHPVVALDGGPERAEVGVEAGLGEQRGRMGHVRGHLALAHEGLGRELGAHAHTEKVDPAGRR